jgi:hypothetical protein
MPEAYTYPGVYIEEVPSGVRPIIGVSTSATAFVDEFTRGPLDQAVRITSLADFNRRFGGLRSSSEASYAIQQFFLNGGSIAWVVRVAAGSPKQSWVEFLGGSPAQDTLVVRAIDAGEWGDNLQVAVTSAGGTERFNLFVREVERTAGTITVLRDEAFLNLTNTDTTDPRYVVPVVEQGSALVRVENRGLVPPITVAPDPRGGVPTSAWRDLDGGADGAGRRCHQGRSGCEDRDPRPGPDRAGDLQPDVPAGRRRAARRPIPRRDRYGDQVLPRQTRLPDPRRPRVDEHRGEDARLDGRSRRAAA